MIDAKQRMSEALLNLCTKMPLERISVTHLVKAAGSSRQTFYNHFQDMNDLIHYVYHNRVLSIWERPDAYDHYHEYCIIYFSSIIEIKRFMIQACNMSGQNNLSDYIVKYANQWEQKWYLSRHPGKELSIEFQLQIDYHCFGMMHLVISWIKTGMVVPPEKMANLVTRYRNASLAELLK